jgi:HSP20 family molecular chaperone IbpA
MFFAPIVRRPAYQPTLRDMDRLFSAAWQSTAIPAGAGQSQVTQDETSYTLSFDVPGIAKEQLSIGIEGNVVRIESLPEAPRQYTAAYELPVDIDVAHSEAKLEHGVLTLKLAKLVPVSQVKQLTIN